MKCKICNNKAVIVENKEYYCADCMINKIKKNEKKQKLSTV